MAQVTIGNYVNWIYIPYIRLGQNLFKLRDFTNVHAKCGARALAYYRHRAFDISVEAFMWPALSPAWMRRFAASRRPPRGQGMRELSHGPNIIK